MKVKLMIQRDSENTIKDYLLKLSEAKPKKVYYFMGNFKETGFDIIEECIIDSKAKKLFVIGVDKKNTTRKMLESLYKYTKNVYLHNNNNSSELDASTLVFEYETKAHVLISSGNISEGGLVDDTSIYTEIVFDLSKESDKAEYKEYITGLETVIKFEELRKLDKEYINELVETKEIFTTRQFTHNVMSISELLNSSKSPAKTKVKVDVADDIDTAVVEENVYDENGKVPAIDLSGMEDVSIDIDIDDVTDVVDVVEKPKAKKTTRKKVEQEEKQEQPHEFEDSVNQDDEGDNSEFDSNAVLDIEGLLFEKSDIKLDKKTIENKVSKAKAKKQAEAKKREELAVLPKKIDLNKVTNLVIELADRPSKGKDVNTIKIPIYIKEMIPMFFEAIDNARSTERKDGIYKEAEVVIEVVDVLTGEKHTDKSRKSITKIRTKLCFV